MENRIKNFNVVISAKVTEADNYHEVCKLAIGECDGDNSYISMDGIESLRIGWDRGAISW